jgi:hypothetical protein
MGETEKGIVSDDRDHPRKISSWQSVYQITEANITWFSQ